MLDQIRSSPKMLKLWKTQSRLKKETENVFLRHEDGGMAILLRGDKRVESIEVDGEERKDIKDLINDGMKRLDKKLEKEMKSNAGDLMEMLK